MKKPFPERLVRRWVEVHPVDHCNFRCEGCSHFSPYHSPMVYSAADYLAGMAKLAPHITFNRIWLLGGEPTLHPDLPGFVEQLSANPFQARLGLSTNGWWLTERGVERLSGVFTYCKMLRVSLHAELERHVEIKQALKHLDAIQELYGVRVVVYNSNHNQTGRFHRLVFRQVPKMRPKCAAARSPQLLANGTLARCPIIAYADQHGPEPHIETFLEHRASGLIDLETIDADSLRCWLGALPKCCAYCAYSDESLNEIPNYAG